MHFLIRRTLYKKYIDIAFADLNDYLEYGRELVPVMGPFGPVTVKDELTGETVELKKRDKCRETQRQCFC